MNYFVQKERPIKHYCKIKQESVYHTNTKRFKMSFVLDLTVFVIQGLGSTHSTLSLILKAYIAWRLITFNELLNQPIRNTALKFSGKKVYTSKLDLMF